MKDIKKKKRKMMTIEAPVGSLVIPPDKINTVFKYIFVTGMKCWKLHPDDNTYDDIHLQDGINKVIKSLGGNKSKYKNGGHKQKI